MSSELHQVSCSVDGKHSLEYLFVWAGEKIDPYLQEVMTDHEEISDRMDRIAFLFLLPDADGKVPRRNAFSVKKSTPAEQALHGYDIVAYIWSDIWEAIEDELKHTLLDELLSYIKVSPRGVLKVEQPDVKYHAEILARGRTPLPSMDILLTAVGNS